MDDATMANIRVQSELIAQMTPEQLVAAATAIRAIEAPRSTRIFYAETADGLERLASRKAAGDG